MSDNSFRIVADGVPEVQAFLRELGPDAGAALRLMSNAIGEHAQRAMRGRLPQVFTFRGTQATAEKAIVFQAAKHENPTRTQAILKVGSDVGGTKATGTRRFGQILARHEEAGVRSSGEVFRMSNGQTFVGGFFIPDRSIRSASANPPKALYPVNIGAKLRRDPAGAEYYAKSKRKTRTVKGEVKRGESFYVIPNVGIFRRRQSQFGSLRGSSVMSEGEPLWWFHRQVRTPARLGLWETAEDIFARFGQDYALEAIETVLARGGVL